MFVGNNGKVRSLKVDFAAGRRAIAHCSKHYRVRRQNVVSSLFSRTCNPNNRDFNTMDCAICSPAEASLNTARIKFDTVDHFKQAIMLECSCTTTALHRLNKTLSAVSGISITMVWYGIVEFNVPLDTV